MLEQPAGHYDQKGKSTQSIHCFLLVLKIHGILVRRVGGIYMLVSSNLAVPSYAQFETSSDEMSLSQQVKQGMHVSSDLVVPSDGQFENSLDKMSLSHWVFTSQLSETSSLLNLSGNMDTYPSHSEEVK
jgi:hypothetical protein